MWWCFNAVNFSHGKTRRAESRQRRSGWRWRRCAKPAFRSCSSKRSPWTGVGKACSWTKEWAWHTCAGFWPIRITCRWIRSGRWSSICPTFSWVNMIFLFDRKQIEIVRGRFFSLWFPSFFLFSFRKGIRRSRIAGGKSFTVDQRLEK